jgi:hypothetical protein
MKKLKQLVALFALVMGVGMVLAPVPSVGAIDILSPGCQANNSSIVCKSKGDDAPSMFKIVINTLLYVLGMVAVVMIVIGGIRYTTSNGDAGSVKGAKDTILYSVVGLVVAILAYTIVNFVISWF